MKSMIQIVNELISGGHQVDFYVRKDGGILIRNIDGQHYTGAKGNTRAREMTGQNISEARFKQLKYATEVRMHPVKNVQVKDSIRQEFQRVKKMWNKAFKSKGGKPHPAGYFGWQRIKRTIKEQGEAEALRRIGEAEKYASGVAYSKNVQILAGFIKEAGDKFSNSALLRLAQDVLDNAYAIRDEWIYPAYKQLYDLNNLDVEDQASVNEVARLTRAILRL